MAGVGQSSAEPQFPSALVSQLLSSNLTLSAGWQNKRIWFDFFLNYIFQKNDLYSSSCSPKPPADVQGSGKVVVSIPTAELV